MHGSALRQSDRPPQESCRKEHLQTPCDNCIQLLNDAPGSPLCSAMHVHPGISEYIGRGLQAFLQGPLPAPADHSLLSVTKWVVWPEGPWDPSCRTG